MVEDRKYVVGEEVYIYDISGVNVYYNEGLRPLLNRRSRIEKAERVKGTDEEYIRYSLENVPYYWTAKELRPVSSILI